MIKIENTNVIGWEAAIRGMRNPMNSWDKSDSYSCTILEEITENNCSYRCGGCKNEFVGRPNCTIIGENDHDLMTRLCNAGTDHRKFMRMIAVYVDITAPLYWWKEFDTYKIGTVANSCSTMHKIADKEFEWDDFSFEHLITPSKNRANIIINDLNDYRDIYLNWDKQDDFIQKAFNYNKKQVWWQMIQLLPNSYNQRRTVMLNYEVLANIYKSRKNHKLDEWREFCEWIENLPYSELIINEITKSHENFTTPIMKRVDIHEKL